MFDETGFSYVWEDEINFDIQNLKYTLKHRLQEQYIQNWHSTIFESSKAINYRIFQTHFKLEDYFEILKTQDAIKFCKFRTANYYLPIEIGR